MVTKSRFHCTLILARHNNNSFDAIYALSMSVICYPHPWMSSMDEGSPSMDDTFIHGWGSSIHKWNCHLSDFSHVLLSFGAILAKVVNLCEQNVMDDNHIYGWTNLIHGWKCHQWMSSMNGKTSSIDDIHGWGWQMTDMDRAWNATIYSNTLDSRRSTSIVQK